MKLIKVFVFFTTLLCIVNAQVPTNGLLVYYPFNGNSNDESGNGKHATNYGATLTADRHGQANSAYYLNGNNAYLRLPDNVITDRSTYSFSFWFKSELKNTNETPIAFRNDLNHGFFLDKQGTSSRIRYFESCIAGSDIEITSDYNKILPNNWYHIAIVKTLNWGVTIYVNGELLGYQTNPNETRELYEPSVLGTYIINYTATHFTGILDDVRIYNRSLSLDDIRALHEDGNPVQYSITPSVNDSNWGSILPNTVTSVSEGTNQTFNIVPNTGFQVKDVKIGGSGATGGTSVGAVTSYEFLNVTADNSIYAEFEAMPLNINAVAGSGGSISPSGTINSYYGASHTFNFTPDLGNRVKDVKLNGTSVSFSNNSYTFDLSEATTISVEFETDPNIRMVTLTSTISQGDQSSGTINFTPDSIVEENSTPSVTVSASTGFKIEKVEIVDPNDESDIYTFVPTDDKTFTYNFQNIQKDWEVRAYFVSEDFTLTTEIAQGGAGSGTFVFDPSAVVAANGNTSVTVSAATGYDLEKVEIVDPENLSNPITFVPADSNTFTYNFQNVQKNWIIKGYFVPEQVVTYSVDVQASVNGSVNVNPAAPVEAGNSVTVSITPDQGFDIETVKFTNLTTSDITNETIVNVKLFERTITNISNNWRVEATFINEAGNPQQYSVFTKIGPGGGGIITPEGSLVISADSSQIITATPNTGYQFSYFQLTDGTKKSVNPFHYIPTQNDTITAYFSLIGSEPNTFFVNAATTPGGTIVPSGQNVSVEEGKAKIFKAEAEPGYQFAHFKLDASQTGNNSVFAFRESDGTSIQAVFEAIQDIEINLKEDLVDKSQTEVEFIVYNIDDFKVTAYVNTNEQIQTKQNVFQDNFSFTGLTEGINKITVEVHSNLDQSLLVSKQVDYIIPSSDSKWSTTATDLFFDTGSIAIGTKIVDPNYKLSVKGDMKAQKIKITVEEEEWSDFVFDENYKLKSLKDVEQFIEKNKHLPEIPSAKNVGKEGIEIGEMNAKLLQKIEELTLYIIKQEKEITQLKKAVKKLETK